MKWIVITGDSGGLGSAITHSLLQKEDYGIIGISRHTTDNIKTLQEWHPNRYHHIDYDLSRPEKVKVLYTEKIKPLGPIYGLINNAAFAYSDLVTNASSDQIEAMFRVNVFIPMLMTKYILRDMLLHGTKGTVVHISSVSAHTGYKGLSMYAATKGALESFSRTVAREWGPRGIRSNCVAPGFMDTPMSEVLTPNQKDRIYKRTSLRQQTDIQSVAEAISFLFSEEAASITGTVIHVDNGQC